MTEMSEARYRRLFERMLDGYVRTDLDGNIQLFNAAYQKMHGYSEEELLGMTYMDLTPEKWRSMEAEIMENQTLANGYSELYEKSHSIPNMFKIRFIHPSIRSRTSSKTNTATWIS